jgi:hypothetical protein
MKPLQLLVPAFMVTVGVLCIARPQTVGTWIARMIRLRAKLGGDSAEDYDLTVRSGFVVVIGIVHLFLAFFFFVLPLL